MSIPKKTKEQIIQGKKKLTFKEKEELEVAAIAKVSAKMKNNLMYGKLRHKKATKNYIKSLARNNLCNRIGAFLAKHRSDRKREKFRDMIFVVSNKKYMKKRKKMSKQRFFKHKQFSTDMKNCNSLG